MGRIKNVAKAKIAREKIFFYTCIVAFPILQFLIFYVGVNVNSFVLAFQRWEGDLNSYVWNGLENFKQIFSDLSNNLQIKIAMENSIKLFVIGVLVGSTLALVFSYYIYKKFIGYRFFKTILFLPSVVSSVTLAIMLMYFATDATKALVGKELLTDTATKLPTLIVISVMLSFGVQVLIYSGAMSGIPESIAEAAVLDGITPLKELVLIDVPMIWPTISVFIVSSIAQAFLNQMNVFNMYGAGAPDISIYTIGYYLYSKILGATLSEYPYYSAFGLVLTFITVPVAFLVKFALDKFGPSVE